MKLEVLKEELSKIDINLNEEQLSKLDKYLSFMFEYNKNVNLTAIKDYEEGVEKHLYDSLLIAKDYDLNNKDICDLGSGAGLPGIPLAILYPNSNLYLVEPTTKRCVFLEKVKELLDLKNVTIINDRAENLKSYQEKFDIVTSRAVAKLNILLEISSQLVKVNGILLAMKAKTADEELKEASSAIKKLSFEYVDTKCSELPESKETRNNIIIKKIDRTKQKYPRSYSDITRRPL